MEEIISTLHNFFQKIIGRELPNLVSEINIALISKKRHYKKQSKTKNLQTNIHHKRDTKMLNKVFDSQDGIYIDVINTS